MPELENELFTTNCVQRVKPVLHTYMVTNSPVMYILLHLFIIAVHGQCTPSFTLPTHNMCMYIYASLTHRLKGIVANYTPACTEPILFHIPTDDFLQVVIQ